MREKRGKNVDTAIRGEDCCIPWRVRRVLRMPCLVQRSIQCHAALQAAAAGDDKLSAVRSFGVPALGAPATDILLAGVEAYRRSRNSNLATGRACAPAAPVPPRVRPPCPKHTHHSSSLGITQGSRRPSITHHTRTAAARSCPNTLAAPRATLRRVRARISPHHARAAPSLSPAQPAGVPRPGPPEAPCSEAAVPPEPRHHTHRAAPPPRGSSGSVVQYVPPAKT
jgi:hypothetical protein